MFKKINIVLMILFFCILFSCQINSTFQNENTQISSPELNNNASKTTYGNILEVDYCDIFNFVWNDRGSGAPRDGSFYKPLPLPGYYNLGYYAQSDYDSPYGRVVTVKGEIGAGKPLVYPVDYSLIWADHGSGADRDGAFWRPIPPGGYVALGTVVTSGYNKPGITEVVCVRADLATAGKINSLIWSDKDSSADKDISTWSIEPLAYDPYLRDDNGLPSGMFYGIGNYSVPTANVYVLKGDYYMELTIQVIIVEED